MYIDRICQNYTPTHCSFGDEWYFRYGDTYFEEWLLKNGSTQGTTSIIVYILFCCRILIAHGIGQTGDSIISHLNVAHHGTAISGHLCVCILFSCNILCIYRVADICKCIPSHVLEPVAVFVPSLLRTLLGPTDVAQRDTLCNYHRFTASSKFINGHVFIYASKYLIQRVYYVLQILSLAELFQNIDT